MLGQLLNLRFLLSLLLPPRESGEKFSPGVGVERDRGLVRAVLRHFDQPTAATSEVG